MYLIKDLQIWIERAINEIPLSEGPSGLYAPVAHIMSIGGKRLRPLLCLLSHNLFNEQIANQVLMPAIGLEIFHGFTLVHDDIMDDSPLRRGASTVHRKWNNNTAILSGDVMCILAYQYLCKSAPEKLPVILQLFGKTAAQVCEGQQLDMNYESLPLITEDDYLTMINLKTAVLIAASVQIGAITGGASHKQAEQIYAFGHHLGMAFQIQDDLLDVYGDSNNFGKTIGNDIVTNKKTFLLVTAFRLAKGAVQQELNQWLADKNVTPEEKIKNIKVIYDMLDIRQHAEEKITEYFTRANEVLQTIDVEPQRKEQLCAFAEQLINRNK
ncbi:MAG: polyprenyl synthetase family protein [Prevotellaceae bacterium]|jgi:geranylgeranyl diphosphate synthase type II|nr:polyprenyl synthetase family protein [Prevotellaceae bacterium]